MFLFGRKNVKSASTLAETVAQKREAYRANVSFSVAYELDVRAGARSAEARDLSAGGVRLLCDEDLIDGEIVTLAFTLPSALVGMLRVERSFETGLPYRRRRSRLLLPPSPFAPMRVRARAIAVSLDPRAMRFEHGLQFVDVPESVREEIRRFIHLWQLRELRIRRSDTRA